MNRSINHFAFMTSLLLAGSLFAEAAAAHGKRMRHLILDPAILGANVEPCRDDASLTCLHLVGIGLHDGVAADVMLDHELLETHVLEGKGSNLQAVLPDPFEPGAREVRVTTADGDLAAQVMIAEAVPGYMIVSAVGTFSEGSGDAEARCPAESVVTGGGYLLANLAARIYLNNPVGNAWQVVATSPLNTTGSITAFAVCIDPATF